MASKILIVEDEPDIVELLVYNLHQAGFETDAVLNGADALEQVQNRAARSRSLGSTASQRWTDWRSVAP